MLNNFAKNQKGGVSPEFAILISSMFLVIGGALYLQGPEVYGLFDTLANEVKRTLKL